MLIHYPVDKLWTYVMRQTNRHPFLVGVCSSTALDHHLQHVSLNTLEEVKAYLASVLGPHHCHHHQTQLATSTGAQRCAPFVVHEVWWGGPNSALGHVCGAFAGGVGGGERSIQPSG